MQDHSDAFSPTVPDDVEDEVPAPGAPSQERPEYDGEPNYRGSNDAKPRPGSVESDDDDEFVSFDDSDPDGTGYQHPVDPADPKQDDGTLQENPSLKADDGETTAANDAGQAETAQPEPAKTSTKTQSKGSSSRPSSRS